MSNEYIYLFTRQDLSPQQQIIQTAHAIHQVGCNTENRVDPPNAVLIGIDSEKTLFEIKRYLDSNEIQSEIFYEPDIDSHTSIATYPITGKQRKLFQHFSLM